MIGIKTQLDFYISLHTIDLTESGELCSNNTNISTQILKDILNILLKLITNENCRTEYIINSKVLESINRLLNSSPDLSLTQDVLRLLINMTERSEVYLQEIARNDTPYTLLNILSYEDLETKQLALQLIASLLAQTQVKEYFHALVDFLHTFISLLSHDNVKLLFHAIWGLTHLADNEDFRRLIRLEGALPLLVTILEKRDFDYCLPSTTNKSKHGNGSISKKQSLGVSEPTSRDQLFDLQVACCTLLAELSYDYTNGQTIIDKNGIYVIAMLLFPENEEYQKSEKFNHLQRNVFRTLRYLFPLNKNREQYKKLFTPQTFELFLEIGNFQRDLSLYKKLTETWNSTVSFDEMIEIKTKRLRSLDPKREPTRYVKDYGVFDCLGSGAFGSVYRVAKRNATTMCAMKEIDNRSFRSGGDVEKSLGTRINEVKIIREELRHPNVVSYYRMFHENEKLYIVMELISGSSLQDFLTLLKETRSTMSEENIWKVFVQLILALRYLHKEKGIVHRDLTANNIMLDDEYRVKITDFGLAKLLDNDCSKMTSVVGTMYYACPEIIQHLPYNEKADIWSLGCVLYHMATLVPPFFTSNLLSLASKICASDYDQQPLKHYSDRIRHVIVECLCIDSNRRPDIYSVAQLCTEYIMIYTDRACTNIQKLEKRLRQQDSKRLNYHQRCWSCSSAKESIVNGGDVSFDDQQSIDTVKQYTDDFAGGVFINTRSPDGSNIGNISSDGGYDSGNRRSVYQSPSPSTPDRRDNNSLVRPRPTSAGSATSIVMPHRRLRATDPVTQLLDVVHKIIFITQTPPTISDNNSCRRLIERYKRFLFSKRTSQNLKSELSKLASHSMDCIQFDVSSNSSSTSAVEHLVFKSITTNSSAATNKALNPKTIDLTIHENDGYITYEQMMSFIEQILQETSYYNQTTSDSLPPPSTSQKARLPSGKKSHSIHQSVQEYS
ncbi:unnamed protein product [Didymodactylos carnosus]|uniref:Protein kinase domain-containing protein n=1 Tax=Didymodactylos carnosus TaxID=1234261 RepID=A0A813PG20_9BILA|nr:unnamed protein product [Didymodactylos carnosus]CAF0754482.1 unnamed protein product [Didymodactylos carnosus]CAF3519718.1 unnamed protein product [Didymodactylos carnosus]CAF3534655.1 unnamed protein product [Didymodactylos carnosus]